MLHQFFIYIIEDSKDPYLCTNLVKGLQLPLTLTKFSLEPKLLFEMARRDEGIPWTFVRFFDDSKSFILFL